MKPQQTSFLDMPTPVIWRDKVLTLSYYERDIIAGIISLYNNGQGFDLDPTYSTGRFWKGLPHPKYRSDIEPQQEGTIQANAEELPFASESIKSIMFDPPFVDGSRADGKPGIIKTRFSYC